MGHEGTIFPVIRVRVSDGQIQYDHFAVMKAAVAIGNDLPYTLVDIGFCLQKEPFFMQQFPNGFGILGHLPDFSRDGDQLAVRLFPSVSFGDTQGIQNRPDSVQYRRL